MRASLQTGGVPVELKYRPRRPRRPEIFVLCDVSTSVTSASVFFLSVLHALHDAFRKMRSFVFVERISEVTDVFERERSFKAVSAAISKDAGVADVSGYTDYGRVWREFLASVDPNSAKDEQVALRGANLFAAYLKAARADDHVLHTTGPGRFLLPGQPWPSQTSPTSRSTWWSRLPRAAPPIWSAASWRRP